MPDQAEHLPVQQPELNNAGLYKICRNILSGSVRNTQKMSDRSTDLLEHPEKRIRVDVPRLKEIIDFIDFKCHPDSSIARNQAIRNSDIDRGLVVTKEEVSEEAKDNFVKELRKQGFDVTLNDGTNKESLSVSNMISFQTQSELEESKNRRPLEYHTITYVAGYSIR